MVTSETREMDHPYDLGRQPLVNKFSCLWTVVISSKLRGSLLLTYAYLLI